MPLLVEEGYRADGWLGMLLGTRVWYSFCGSVLLGEASFEGKMEELCRELGTWGKPTAPTLNTNTSGAERSELLLLSTEERSSVLVTCLELVMQTLSTVTVPLSRQERKKQMGRVDVVMSLLELDAAQLPTWLSSDWTPEQAAAVAKGISAVRMAKTGSDAVHTVTALLATLDSVAASYIDRALLLQSAVQSSNHEAVRDVLTSVLTHGLAVLDSIALSLPRPDRRAVEAVCIRIEDALERMGDVVTRLSGCEASELSSLCESLGIVDSVRGDAVLEAAAGTACVEAMAAALDRLHSYTK